MSVEVIEPFTCKGHWWLPEKPDERVAGILTYVPQEGGNLELLGSFARAEADFTGFGPEIILGESDLGLVTLHDCILTRLTLGSTNSSSLRIRNVLLGYHFTSENHIRFEKLYVRYSSLDEWINRSGFDKKVLVESVHPPWDKVIVDYELPPAIKIALGTDCEMSLEFRPTLPTLTYVLKEACILQETYVKLAFANQRSLRDCYGTLFHLRNFLTLAISVPIYPLKLFGYVQGCREPIQIFFEQPDMEEKLVPILPFKMLFKFDDVEAKSDKFIKNWYSKRTSLKSIYELYFALVYNPHMYADDRFLNMCRAVEAYHKAMIYGKYKKLRSRISEIIDIFRNIDSTFIPNKAAFLRIVIDTRNQLTHNDVKPKKNAVSGNALFFAAEQLRLLVEMCLLKEAGFTVDEIQGLFAKNDKHQQLIQSICQQTT
jgi:ApeA N-terminal domain 1